MDLKDSPPFEIYFEKQFLRIINKIQINIHSLKQQGKVLIHK